MSTKIESLVADTTAFIKNASLHELAENVYTVQKVIDEVTSKAQLKRLVVLPYELKIRDPFPEHIQFISDFAKKTGDYLSLSATDIQLLALTYQLEKELNGTEHLKTVPTFVQTNASRQIETEQIAGFFMPSKTSKDVDAEELATEECAEIETVENREESDEYSDYSEEDEDADIGWITPENISQVKKEISGCEDLDTTAPKVACVTSDFAMQNVLRQVGLQVVSADGKLIKNIRTYILRCYACFKTTTIMTKVFCPKCGNRTLKRVAVTLNEDGSMIMHFSRKPLSARGKQQSLPMPKSGKHANNDIRFEDQPIPQQRATRLARTKNNPLDPDYVAGFSPFVTRDTNSRAAMLGINSSWANRSTTKSGGPFKKRTHKRK